jgi:hypothetical protein
LGHMLSDVSYQSLSRSWHTDLDYSSFSLSKMKIGLTAGVTGQQVLMLTLPWHLIPPLVFSGVHVSLIFTVDCFIAWTGHWFWLQIFPLTWHGVLILTVDCSVYLILTHWFWLLIFTFDMGCMAGATGRQGMLTPPWHLIPPLIYMYSEVCVRPFFDLYFL